MTYELSEDDVIKMFWKSPISVVDKIETPTLFCLGKHDKWIPPGISIYMAKCLKSWDVACSVKLFDDNHLLSKPEVSLNYMMSVTWWFVKYLK